MKTHPSFSLLLVLFFVSICFCADAQNSSINKYLVTFTDKEGVEFDPLSYFHAKALARRLKGSISTNDETDKPVKASYIASVSKHAQRIVFVSRWLNGVILYASRKQLDHILSISFVKEVELLDRHPVLFTSKNKKTGPSDREINLLRFQTDRMKGRLFKQHGLDGKGICIAVFDAGFPGVDKSPAFAHIVREGRIQSTYDFVLRKTNVFAHNAHGTMVLSCIAGMHDTINIGLATGATFLLARTEDANFEPDSEEENWLAAAEWADKNGADIINSSLGYSFKRYFEQDMNGHTSLVSRAASLAARKGILVINAAGNEGEESWKHLVTPADGDSVLAVGGTDPATDCHISFSSFGPSADLRLKPNVSALGTVMAAGPNQLEKVSGTSFASPLVAGFAACAWQLKHQLNNMELFNAIEKSGHLYPYFDYAHGYGIPQASVFFPGEQKLVGPTFDFVLGADSLVHVFVQAPYVLADKGLPVEDKCNFYFSIKSSDGHIKSYSVLTADEKEVLKLLPSQYQHGDILTVHFEGFTNSIVLP